MRNLPSSICRAATLAAGLLWFGPASALPSAPSVFSGSATFERSSVNTHIVAALATVIDWASFSINAGESAVFILPETSTAVVNRVMPGQPTVIAGNLTAYGGLTLINPAGIHIAPGAVVAASFLTLSTLDPAEADLLAGDPARRTGMIAIEGTIAVAGRADVLPGIVADSSLVAIPNRGGSQLQYGGTLVLSAVPEPSVYALMLAGLTCLRLVTRRRIR